METKTPRYLTWPSDPRDCPNRTDFKDWSREGLEKFAREVADDNYVLRQAVEILFTAYRKEVARCIDAKQD